MTRDTEQIKLEEYNRFAAQLDEIQNFVNNHTEITYVEFDHYVAHNMTLFSIDLDFDFEKLENTILSIRKSMPSIKRIFNKPIIVLKDIDDVMPVENARIINQNTLFHLANHSHHVENITKDGVRPRKLLTRLNEDDYSIYENVVFCNFIDDVLLYVRKNRRILDSLLYASEILRFNLLEKVNHMNYFLALGKLHTGYIRDFNQYFSMSKRILHELSHVSKAITPRLHKPIYRLNSKRNRYLPLKKTNIFLMQKDYRQVYKLYKNLLGNQKKDEDREKIIDLDLMNKKYLTYVQILTIFAVGHFNFDTESSIKMDLNALDIAFTFKDWNLNISNNEKKEVILVFIKDNTYRILLTNHVYNEIEQREYMKEYGLNELVVVSPFDEDYLERKDVYISMQDIDSFRRIQQIILRGMIYSDTKRDVCPFCGGALHKNTRMGYYQCNDCEIQIKEKTCQETNEPFYYTDNSLHRKHVVNKSDFDYDEHWYYEKQVEALMYYRNITNINQNNEIICPHCHQVHEN